MPRFAANIRTMFTDRPFAERIQAAAAGFSAIECQVLTALCGIADSGRTPA